MCPFWTSHFIEIIMLLIACLFHRIGHLKNMARRIANMQRNSNKNTEEQVLCTFRKYLLNTKTAHNFCYILFIHNK